MRTTLASLSRKALSAAKFAGLKLMKSRSAKITRTYLQDNHLSLAAIGCISAGVAMIYLPAGLIVLGILLFALEAKTGS